MEQLFWISLGLAAYAYLGYPPLLAWLAPIVRRLRGPRGAAASSAPSTPFSVSLVVSMHNEEKLIAARIANFEALEYPSENLEFLLADDCSTDRTREIVRSCAARNPRIRMTAFDEHLGKTEAIQRIVAHCRSEILVFSDANTFFEPQALQRLVRHFADPKVGVVCGRLLLRDPSGRNVEQRYWRFESAMKRLEADLGVVLGANGGIYAIRRELFRPLRSDVVQADDFLWPVFAHQGGRCGVYEPQAVAHEDVAPSVEAELLRKVRIGTGNCRALLESWRMLLPWKGWIAFVYWSHKALRWATPLFLAVMLVTNALLLDQPFFRATFALQVAFYGMAGLGRLLTARKSLVAKVARLPYYFVGSNLALAIGFYRCITGRQKAAWSQKAHREG